MHLHSLITQDFPAGRVLDRIRIASVIGAGVFQRLCLTLIDKWAMVWIKSGIMSRQQCVMQMPI
jgi:hypothetical protein